MTAFNTAASLLAGDRRGPVTPADFAVACSRGKWRRAPHLDIIEAACLDAIADAAGVTLSAAVRHGKSEYASLWLPAWFLGRNPDKRVILATHGARFARTWGRRVRNILDEYGPTYFGIQPDPGNAAADEWGIKDHDGGMVTVGVGGAVIGRGGDLIVVDDPLKSWEAAMSPLQRERVAEWWTGTMESRREPGSAAIIICARWHEDDLTGVLHAQAPHDWTDVRLPAICDDPEHDPLGRSEGEALWPERYSAEALAKTRERVSLTLGSQVWDAQYQQRPTSPEGGMFSTEWPTISRDDAHRGSAGDWVRRWDLAATAAGGDWTVGVLMTRLTDGRFVVVDRVAGQWAPDDVRIQLAGCAASDPDGTRIVIPQDPGQAGKDQAQQIIRMLAPRDVVAIPETGSKETRANGFAAQQRAGNVLLAEASWNRGFAAELAGFPRAKHDDQVDAAAGAFNALAAQVAQVAQVATYRQRAVR